jgi:hypothetical protein
MTIRKIPIPAKDTHLQSRPIAAINAAFYYLDEPKKRKKFTRLVCIGPKTITTKELIGRINFPPLPLLAGNKALRESLKPREKSPLFKIVASAIGSKYYDLKEQISDAIQQEKEKAFCGINDYPLRIESTEDALPEEKEAV